jgi:hypothetical protein
VESTPVVIPEASGEGGVTSNGEIGETNTVNGSESSVFIWIQWTTEKNGGTFDKGSYIQNWAQWESITFPGKYSGMSCSANYEDESTGTTSAIGVANYADVESIDNEAAAGKTWDGLETNPINWFKPEDDSHQIDNTYARVYEKKNYSSQNCGAWALLHHTVDGEVPASHGGHAPMYWNFKNAGALGVQTGFRIYEDGYATEFESSGEAGEVQFDFYDWGLVDPNATDDHDHDHDDDMADSGASAMLSAAATAIAAFILF